MMIKKKNLIILAVILIIIGVIILFRILTPEDTWICQNGEWVKHGNPTAPQPVNSCK